MLLLCYSALKTIDDAIKLPTYNAFYVFYEMYDAKHIKQVGKALRA